LITLLPQLIARRAERAADLRLLEPTMPLKPLSESML
jgi:hypothetical protein